VTFHSCYLSPWGVLRKNCDNRCLNNDDSNEIFLNVLILLAWYQDYPKDVY